MYWGYPDASVSFCEDKYNVLPYVAEYYNTMSAISYLIVGLILKNFKKLNKISNSILFLGVGTMLLHGTLRKYGQWIDECGMLSFSYDVIVEYRRRKNKTTNFGIRIWPSAILAVRLRWCEHLRIDFSLPKRHSCKQHTAEQTDQVARSGQLH